MYTRIKVHYTVIWLKRPSTWYKNIEGAINSSLFLFLSNTVRYLSVKDLFTQINKESLTDSHSSTHVTKKDNLSEAAGEYVWFNGFKRFPPHDFAKAWNSVGDMRYQTNFSIFKHWLNDNLFTQMYSDE